jgi:very-short-patch-repair endonuclease
MAGVQFRRQHTIGKYIVDFCSPRRKLIIELDGSQHLDQAEYDLERTQYLEAKGYRVLRFWNKDIMNDIETALNTIWNEINKVP